MKRNQGEFEKNNNIEILSERLGSLQITEEASTNNKQMDTEMSTAPALMAVTGQENIQTELLENMVLDPEWFNGD